MTNDDCGPVDDSVLYGQANHISTTIWNRELREKLTIRQSTSNLGQWRLNDYQVHLLQQWGFGKFVNPKSVMQNDVCLITAVVERWRPETNTFHFTFGEMTVTLEDVYMLMGLPVVGEPIKVDDEIPGKKTWFLRWHDPALTDEERKSALDRGGVKLNFLREKYGTCPSSTDRDMMVIYMRAYVLYLCGAILFPTKSNNAVHPRLILYLEDSNKIYGYAWGAAVLAYLYRNLKEASRKDVKSISGCTTVLMLWSRERLRPGQPLIAAHTRMIWPRALAWAVALVSAGRSKYYNIHHNIDAYRGMFDNFYLEWLRWRPYERFYRRDDEHFERALIAGIARVPLHYFEDVEYQLPERVPRQFNMPFCILPYPPTNMRDLRTARGMSELCLHEMPPVFHDSILPTFVRGYDEFMLETFGPTYERPDFKNVPPKRKARRTMESTSQPFESEYFKEYEAYQ
ncbi:protein MAIN-LIKE 1-like [Daucus carota subsp. sativus]|uniref:protein MAIN-LIKE 1-like n=1 Tax=Daucus carota subsp. sativus TaxID=79200 RepID=UPI0030839AD1